MVVPRLSARAGSSGLVEFYWPSLFWWSSQPPSSVLAILSKPQILDPSVS